MSNDLTLKTVLITQAQSVLECPHCHKPGYSFIAPVGTKQLRMIGQCPSCEGVFIIKIMEGEQVNNVRRIIAEAIYHIVHEAKRNLEVNTLSIQDRIKGVVSATPDMDLLGQVPEFGVRFVSGSLSVEAKNAAASNILDMLEDMQTPTDMKTGELSGV